MQALHLLWAISFDLHVLGMPPAFILSQDQTLQKNLFFIKFYFIYPSYQKLTFCSVFKEHFLFFLALFSSAIIIYHLLFIVSTLFLTFFLLFSLFLSSYCSFCLTQLIIYQIYYCKSTFFFFFYCFLVTVLSRH